MSFYDLLVTFIISFVSFYVVSGRFYNFVDRDNFKYFVCIAGAVVLLYILRFGVSINFLGLFFSFFLFLVFCFSFFYEKRK